MNQPIRRIGLVLRRDDHRLPGILSTTLPLLRSKGFEVCLDDHSAERYGCDVAVCPESELPGKCDAIAVFGGDGTLLHAARLVAARGLPILGVNLGSLGFLTEVKLEEMGAAFDSLRSGKYSLEERMLLSVSVFRNGQEVSSHLALNDAVINRGALSRIIELEVTVNSQLVTLTRSDGLIVSTPTGSTAYALAAGGPILYPTLGACVITTICPHTLTNRPVVVPDTAIIGVRMVRGTEVMLTLDGQVGMPLESGDRLEIRKAAAVTRLVQPNGTAFFTLLREKMKWG
jgi:NAD+ kinase